MTNFENMMKNDIELIKDAVAATIGLKKEKPVLCGRIACGECDCGPPNCGEKMIKWLDAEYKEPVKLNEQERLFCEMIEDGYFARDAGNSLFWYENKPFKSNGVWDVCGGKCYYLKVHTMIELLFKDNLHFDFIKWEDEEPWSVKDILEVAEDED